MTVCIPHDTLAADVFPLPTCHLSTKSTQKLLGTLLFTFNAPGLQADDWIAYSPLPPELPGQHLSRAVMDFANTKTFASAWTELSEEHRYLLRGHLRPANGTNQRTTITVRSWYYLNLFARQLVPGAEKSPPSLSQADKKLFTSTTSTLNFQTSTFDRWLTANKLIKRHGERDIDFAWRTYRYIGSKYNYNYVEDQDRSNSGICTSDSTDCGGFSFLFAGIMRANGVPARALIGRWVKANTLPDQALTNATDVGECHVKAEFWAEGIGWIPVDATLLVSNKGANPQRYFGQIGSNFVTFHIDPDLIVDAGRFGRKNITVMQRPAFWVEGPGALTPNTDQTIWAVSAAPGEAVK